MGTNVKSLNIKVFAFYSSYLESKYFIWMQHNITQELCGILLIAGFLFIAFSKEKRENEKIQAIRIRSFILTVYVNSAFIVLSLLFTYGIAFLEMLIINIVLGLLLYILIFRFYIYKYRSYLSDNSYSENIRK